MISETSAEEPASRPLVKQALGLLETLIVEIHATIERLQSGEAGDLKDGVRAVRDLRTALQIAFEERTKIARIEGADGGPGSGGALDLDAARAEIGRRLARLRDAGGG